MLRLGAWLFWTLFWPLYLTGPSLAGEFCAEKKLAEIPVLAEGRVKPLVVHASEFRKKYLASTSCPSLSDVRLYCELSFSLNLPTNHISWFESAREVCPLFLDVRHQELKRLLGVDPSMLRIDVEPLSKQIPKLRETYQRLVYEKKEKSGLGVAIAKIIHQFQALRGLVDQSDWQVLGEDGKWYSLNLIESKAKAQALIESSMERLNSSESAVLRWELVYHHSRPFFYASFLCLVAILFSLLSWLSRSPLWTRLAWGFALTLGGLEVFGMILRVVVSGRAPVTNMYETVMWTGMGILLFALILARLLKERHILTFGLGLHLIALFMLNFSPTMLDPSIRPLVPVLRDNFWLSTHVTTVTLSYSLFSLSWGVANWLLMAWLIQTWRGRPHETVVWVEKWNSVNRICIQLGNVLLALGIILGGVWADYSWGRFWGWDPKETWSLIAFVIYAVVLHCKYTGWLLGIHFTLATAAAYLSILMAWFGVNYVLASGLHSYGFSESSGFFLLVIIGCQLTLISVVLGQWLGMRKLWAQNT